VVPLPLVDGEVDLRVLVDTCSVETFAAGGRVVLTNQVFPRSSSRGVALRTLGSPAEIVSLTLRDLTVGDEPDSWQRIPRSVE
jgi:sucrose-6-phosphate hydrolase SacC (GH32 family)